MTDAISVISGFWVSDLMGLNTNQLYNFIDKGKAMQTFMDWFHAKGLLLRCRVGSYDFIES